MKILVQKYGGTSVGSVDKIQSVAKRIIETKNNGWEIVVVVSAMQHTTDELIKLAHNITQNPSDRELDMLLTAGERISMALLSMAIWEKGYESISFTGSQSGIITEDNHTRARIIEVKATRILEELALHRIVIVAGFQGVSGKREITTLGRGGSDTTAVALASALGAERCEIFTDVDGVYTADPNIVSDAFIINKISYNEMLDLAYFGAGVMHPRSIEIGRVKKVPIVVRSSYNNNEGTLISEVENMEQGKITGVSSKNILYVNYNFKNDDELNELLNFINKKRIPIDQFRIDNNIVKFWCDTDFKTTIELFPKIITDENLSVISIIGNCLSGRIDLIQETMKILEEMNIKPFDLYQSHLSLVLLVNKENADEIVKIFHRNFITRRRKFGL